METGLEYRGDSTTHGIHVNSNKSSDEPSGNVVVVVQPAHTENQVTDIIFVNKWGDEMPAMRNETNEKERLLKEDVRCDEEYELDGFVSSGEDSGVAVETKLLIVDPDNESLSSIGEDDPTFSTSKLIVLDDDISRDKVSHSLKSKQKEVEIITDNEINISDYHETMEYTGDGVVIETETKSENGNDDDDVIEIVSDVPVTEDENETSMAAEVVVETKNAYEAVIPAIERKGSDETFALEPLDDTRPSSSDEAEAHDVEETSFSTTQHIEHEESSGLLQPPEEEAGDEEIEDGDGDDFSVLSEFHGSLGIDVLEIPWETDIHRVVDVQLGENEWSTAIYAPEGGVRLEGWETEIYEISKQEDLAENWDTSINEMSEDEDLHAEWNTTIAENFENKELKIDWSTTFKVIEKADEGKNKWTTLFNKIKSHVARKDEWKTTFNSMELKTGDKNDWKFKLPAKLLNRAKALDWNTRFTVIEGSSSATDPWENTFREMLLKSDDRESHWETKFFSIADNTEELNPWSTTFFDIAPTEEEEMWDTTFYAISEEKDQPEDWNTTFIDIEEHVPDENEWTIKREDVPDNFNEPADWSTAFNLIENHHKNLLWETMFQEILPPDETLEIWETDFYATDITDIDREMWETTYNGILPNENEEYDWTIQVNPIEVEE